MTCLSHPYSRTDLIMSAQALSPSPSSLGLTEDDDEEHRGLLATPPADQKRPGPPDKAGNYGTLNSKADIDVDTTDVEARGGHDEERQQREDAALIQHPAVKGGKRSVIRTSPILAIGVRRTLTLCLLQSDQGNVTEGQCPHS